MTFPSDVATVVVLQVISAGREVSRASVTGLLVRVLQCLLIDRGIVRELPLHLHIPPPGGGILN